MYSALTYTCLLSPVPSFVYVPALGLTILQCPPTLTSLELENSTLHEAQSMGMAQVQNTAEAQVIEHCY